MGETGRLAGVTGSEYDNSGETGNPKAWGARGEAAATVLARISKGVTGNLDALDGGGVRGGKRADVGVGPPPMDMRVNSSLTMRGDGVVLRAETRLSVVWLAEERPDKY
jgi:hypothetical protein